MVVLDRPRLDVELEGVLGGQVLRVQIVGHHLRIDPEQPAEVRRCLQERLIGGEVLEVTDVVAAHEERLLGHRHGVLELGADGEHLARRLARKRQRPRARSRGTAAPSAAVVLSPARPSRRNGCGSGGCVPATPSTSGPSRAKASSSVVSDGIVGQVAAAHHERAAHLCHEQVVQRRVGEHHARDPPCPARRRRRRRRPACAGRGRWVAGRTLSADSASRSSTHRDRAISRSATMRAKGLSSLALRRRSSATASALVASAARW